MDGKEMDTTKQLSPGGPVVRTLPSDAEGAGSTSSQGTRIPHALWPKPQNVKQKQCCNKFNKIFKMVHIKKKSLKMVFYSSYKGGPWLQIKENTLSCYARCPNP